MLAYKVEDRLSARQALKHPYFRNKASPEKSLRVFSRLTSSDQGKETGKLPSIRANRHLKISRLKSNSELGSYEI